MSSLSGFDPPQPAQDTLDNRPLARPRPEPASRFVLISLGGGMQPNINPFHLHRAISRFGEATRVNRRPRVKNSGDGKLEVQMKDVENARKLLDADCLSIQTKNGVRTVPITVVPHPTKGFLTGVITLPDLSDVEDEDILEELRDQGVQRVRRLQRRENGGAVKSNTFVLSFFQSELAEKVRVTWRSIRVRPYIPNPVRCYRCQEYGHVQSSCGRSERCARCSATGHKSSSCDAPKPRCTCGGEHEAWSRKCPKLAKEKQKVRERLSGNTKRTETQSRPDDTNASPRRQPHHAPEPTPYRNALLEDVLPLHTNNMPCPPPPAFTLETKIQDCMQLSLQQLLTLLSDHSCTAQSSKATSTSTRTRDIGIQCHIPETAHVGVQTDPTAHRSVPLLEEDIHRDVAVVEDGGDDGGANEIPTDASRCFDDLGRTLLSSL